MKIAWFFSDEKTKDFLSLMQFLSICYYMLLLLFRIEVNFSLKRMQTLATRFSVDYDNNSNKNDSDRNKLQTRLCKQNNVWMFCARAHFVQCVF